MKNLFREIAPGDRFILGVSDTTPPDAKFERLLRITEMVKRMGQTAHAIVNRQEAGEVRRK